MTPPSPTDKPRRDASLLVACVVAVAGAVVAILAGTQLHISGSAASIRSSRRPISCHASPSRDGRSRAARPRRAVRRRVLYRRPRRVAPDRRLRLRHRPRARLARPGVRRRRAPASSIPARTATRPSPSASRICRPALVRTWSSSRAGATTSSYPAAQLRAAAIETAALTRKRFAGAQIVFLGPIPAHVPAPADQLAVAATLRSAAASCKAIFVDPIEQGWITPGNEKGYIGPCAGASRQQRIRLHRRSGCSVTCRASTPTTGTRSPTGSRNTNKAKYFPRRGGGASLTPRGLPRHVSSPFVRESALTSRPPFTSRTTPQCAMIDISCIRDVSVTVSSHPSPSQGRT